MSALWVNCKACGPILSFIPSGKNDFHIEVTCPCGSTVKHDEKCVVHNKVTPVRVSDQGTKPVSCALQTKYNPFDPNNCEE